MNLIKATQAVVAESAKLIHEAKNAVNNPGDPNNQPRLAQVLCYCLQWAGFTRTNNEELKRAVINT